MSTVVRRQWNGTALQAVERVSYTYYTGADTFGNAGDIRTVTKEVANGNNWVSKGTHYYRYYKPGDLNGEANEIKMVFTP